MTTRKGTTIFRCNDCPIDNDNCDECKYCFDVDAITGTVDCDLDDEE